LKDWHICFGTDCSRDAEFEEFNCAESIETADSEDPLSLGDGEPGCILDSYCDNGLFEPCTDVETVSWSAEVRVDWPEIEVSDYIE